MKKRPEKIEIAEVRINDPDGGETIKLTPEEDGEDVVDDIVADVSRTSRLSSRSCDVWRG